MRFVFIFLVLAALTGCENHSVSSFFAQTASIENNIDTAGMTILSRFKTPDGYERAVLDSNSFG
jgi:hypothetical protein